MNPQSVAVPRTPPPMDPSMDPNAEEAAQRTEGTVLKVIKKWEVEVLCSQHNPVCLLPSQYARIQAHSLFLDQVIAEAKKAQKQDKIRQQLIALPQMSRIKIRVSQGVYEVTLIRVVEETSSVEVLWDRGAKREFKWGSVVFGDAEGMVVGHKPTEAQVEAERASARG